MVSLSLYHIKHICMNRMHVCVHTNFYTRIWFVLYVGILFPVVVVPFCTSLGSKWRTKVKAATSPVRSALTGSRQPTSATCMGLVHTHKDLLFRIL